MNPSSVSCDRSDLLKQTGRIFDIQRCSLHDGPGIRTTVFLKGCPLGCLWCHNPESISQRRQLALQMRLCTYCGRCVQACPHGVHEVTQGDHKLRRDRCTMCGACVPNCPTGALEIIGRDASAEEVIEEVLRDRIFYRTSGGGMTLSGGEPTLQPAFSHALLTLARQEELHTCLDTCGFCEFETLQRLSPLCDLVYFDLKETDPARHKELTGVDNDRILENLRKLDASGSVTQLRCPIVPGLNDRAEHFQALAEIYKSLSHCLGVELLGYHRLGEGKRQRLGMPPADPRIAAEPPDTQTLACWKHQVASRGARAL